jgi:hypothetical protein
MPCTAERQARAWQSCVQARPAPSCASYSLVWAACTIAGDRVTREGRLRRAGRLVLAVAMLALLEDIIGLMLLLSAIAWAHLHPCG